MAVDRAADTGRPTKNRKGGGALPVGVRRPVGEERIDLCDGRRQPGQVEVQPAEQRDPGHVEVGSFRRSLAAVDEGRGSLEVIPRLDEPAPVELGHAERLADPADSRHLAA